MSVSWYRVESSSSPKGHELRAKSRGRTWRTYQAADGTWRVGEVGSPQRTKSCRTLADARAYAERALLQNPNPQSFHSEEGPPMQALQLQENPRRRRSSRTKTKQHVSCGDLSAKKCRQLQHVYTSARKRGYSKKRASQQAWGAVERSRNPMPAEATAFFKKLENPHRRRLSKRRNAESKGHSGWGAFLGSLVGTSAGLLVDSNRLAMLGNVVGAGVGGHIGAADDRKKRGTWGGVIGSVLLGPIGAGIGGYIGGKRPDK